MNNYLSPKWIEHKREQTYGHGNPCPGLAKMQSRMDNLETQATLGTKHRTTTNKTKIHNT
jgi:hypothetical protein